jgi:diguanylate cyclase (GGDEF)-like protein
MASMTNRPIRMCVRLLLALIGAATSYAAAPAGAATLHINEALCHAVSDLEDGQDKLRTLRFACAGTPGDYQRRSLWLRTDLHRMAIARGGVTLSVHPSRFDRLAVAFTYADGTVRWQQVRQGDYGLHWRTGGQILFEAPERTAPLTTVTMRFDRLASHQLVRAQLLSRDESSMRSAGMAAAVSAALTLLLVSCIYSLSLAIAVRRQYLAWQAAWAATMLLWGGLWSQIHLALLPSLAGTVSTQICTFLACLAIALATASAVTGLARSKVSRRWRMATLSLGLSVGLAGVPLALMRSGDIDRWADILGLVILADLAAVATCLFRGWRGGSAEARDFAAAWGLPMAVLAIINLVDVEDSFWGGGSKLLILVAATWQALWLSAMATRRLARLRLERDRARAAEAQARELARRDPLTGLPNRRGFIESVAPLLDRARSGRLPAALLVVDIDRFKSINDIYGHDAGDAVLCRIARRIARWEGPICTVARLGGEEFGLLAIGMEGIALDRFAESVRREIAACDHSETLGDWLVTASIGVAEVQPACDVQRLHRIADDALYEAKHAGRNQVVLQRHAGAGPAPEGRIRKSGWPRHRRPVD